MGTATGKTLTTKDNTTGALYYVVDEFDQAVQFPYIPLGDLKGDSPILENMTTRLTLADVLSDEAFDGHNVLAQLKDSTIKNLPNRMSSMTVGDVYGNDNDNIFIQALKDTQLEKLSDTLDVLTVGEIFGKYDPATGTYVVSENPLLNALASTKINELEEKAKSLTIADIVPGAENNQVLKHLKTATFGNLSEQVETLTFNQVFSDELWKDASTADNVTSFVGTGNNAGYAVDANGNRILKSVWKNFCNLFPIMCFWNYNFFQEQ